MSTQKGKSQHATFPVEETQLEKQLFMNFNPWSGRHVPTEKERHENAVGKMRKDKDNSSKHLAYPSVTYA